jgi:hypothetical protein
MATSEDTLTLVRIVPPALTADKPAALAEWYRFDSSLKGYRLIRTATILSPLMPTATYVANDGTLVTVDSGHKDTVAIYRPDGSLLRSYAYDELFTADYTQCFIKTVAGPEWRGPEENPPLSNTLRDFVIIDARRGTLEFNLDTGKLTAVPNVSGNCPEEDLRRTVEEIRARKQREGARP